MKQVLITTLISIASLISYAQNNQISILNQDIAQGEKFIEAYFTPMAESFGAGLNSGWYNTAKPHSLGGFDITFTLNTVLIPNTAETFNIKNAGGDIFTSNETEASTILGSSDKTTMSYYNASTGISSTFEMPGGFKIPAMPLPIMQAGIGLIKNTAIDIRFMPMLNVGDNINVNLFGVGLKHDILQWIPAIGDAAPMSLSLQWGYTNLNTDLEIYDQKISLNTKANTFNLVVSKKLLLITGYAGIGYNSATTNFAADANFDLDGIRFDEKVEIDFESNRNLRTNIGLRLNMSVVTIQADYTFAKYPTATLGVGVSVR
jgi:hypothetical protein